jgi:hypothetical protein
MAVPVNVYLSNFSVPPQAVEGVLVHVLDATGTVLISSSTTNDEGLAGFLLPGSQAYGGTEYQLRFYKIGLRVDSPQFIQVLEPATEANDFDVQCHDLSEREEALDARLCRLTTTLIDNAGHVVCDAPVSFRLTRHPVVLSKELMLVRDVEVVSDSNGLVVVDLIRGGEYTALLPGYEEGVVDQFTVPDAPAWELTEVLFPYPVSVEFSPAGDRSVAVGQYFELDVTLRLSDGRVLENTDTFEWIDVFASDSNVDLQFWGGGNLRVTGKMAGECTLSARIREDTVEDRIPDYELTVNDIDITVV